MKILMINSVCGIRSTGRICTDIAQALEKEGHTVKIAYGRFKAPDKYENGAVTVTKDSEVLWHIGISLIFDNAGFMQRKTTKKFIDWIRNYDPDIIHLHNIHGYYLNVEVLFEYLKTCGKRIVWTLHDCWAFTGHCAYFDFVQCEKWKTECGNCALKTSYPYSFVFDNSKRNFNLKQSSFTNIPNMTLVTPSQWLADLVSQSMLKEYPVVTIHNEIDTNVFKHLESNIKVKYAIPEDKKIVLGVASIWEKRKGFDDFIKLADEVDENTVIVLVGLSKKQMHSLKSNMIGIEHTADATELAKLYSVADVFLNLTYEDNYPTTNLESIACGTPVVTYDTGGSPESAKYYGMVVAKGNIKKVADIVNNKEYLQLEKHSLQHEFIKKYMELYFG